MDNFREKSQVFILGMLAGLVVAGSFFILKLDDYFKELNVYKNVVKTFYLRSKSQETNVKYEDGVNEKSNVFDKSTNKNKPSESAVLKAEASRSYTDSLNTYGYNDTSDQHQSEEVVVVRKDELVTSKLVELVSFNQFANATGDSLLQKVSGIRDDKNAAKQFFTIELWQSPLNYRGYKMSKYKIVLYGMPVIEGIKVYKIDDEVYLKTISGVYKLEYSDEFGPYQMVNDVAVISKLK